MLCMQQKKKMSLVFTLKMPIIKTMKYIGQNAIFVAVFHLHKQNRLSKTRGADEKSLDWPANGNLMLI